MNLEPVFLTTWLMGRRKMKGINKQKQIVKYADFSNMGAIFVMSILSNCLSKMINSLKFI